MEAFRELYWFDRPRTGTLTLTSYARKKKEKYQLDMGLIDNTFRKAYPSASGAVSILSVSR
jgi:hypothetical protein